MSDTILAISRASAHSKFLKEFYSFTTILDKGVLQIVHGWPDDTSYNGFDVAMLTNLDESSGILIWVVDLDSYQLSGTSQLDIYHNSVLWYRSLSEDEISAIGVDSDVVFDYSFFGDKLFTNFHLRNFQLQMYNSWATMDMYLHIFPNYQEILKWENWNGLPKDELFEYSLTF